MNRVIIDQVICPPIKYGMRLSLDKPLNNCADLNILRPSLFSQYFYKEHPLAYVNCQHSKRYSMVQEA